MDVSELREKPRRPPADRHPHHPARRASRRSRTRSAARSRKANAPIGSARWSRSPRRSTSPPRRRASQDCVKRFGDQVDLVHGRMKGADKDAAMARFAAGESRLLVATTVIEVGVDVPEATIMVIEHAERFGLAQLHQLRGRIGRGAGRIDLPAALQGAARRNRQGAARDPARNRRRLPHRRGGSAAARRRRRARHAPERPARLPHRARSKCTANISAPRATTPR